MLIKAVKLFKANLPLAKPFRHASSGLIDTINSIVLRLETENGFFGYGEVRGNIHYVTGDTPDRVLVVLSEILGPKLIGMDVQSIKKIMETMESLVVGNTSAMTIIDSALHDLRGKLFGKPVHFLLGGQQKKSLLTHASIPFASPENTKKNVEDYLNYGFKILKLRVGMIPFSRDVERMNIVRDTVNSHKNKNDIILGVDANQAWGRKEAIRNIHILSEFGLKFAEQPVLMHDYTSLREVRSSVDIEIVADESCGTPRDLLRLIKEDVADAFHLKLCKAGGITRLMQMASILEIAKLPYIIGQMDEGMLATAAAVHCGLVCSASSYELWGYHRIAKQPYTGIKMTDGNISIDDSPGLGINVDENGLDLVRSI